MSYINHKASSLIYDFHSQFLEGANDQNVLLELKGLVERINKETLSDNPESLIRIAKYFELVSKKISRKARVLSDEPEMVFLIKAVSQWLEKNAKTLRTTCRIDLLCYRKSYDKWVEEKIGEEKLEEAFDDYFNLKKAI